MLFNSDEFLVFFAVFIALYWLVRRSLFARNILIVVASYVFYCWWDYRFGALLLLTSLADYSFGRLIQACPAGKRRKALLTASMALNLTVLGYFKYFSFFKQSLISMLQTMGWEVRAEIVDIVLPVGISFYTFQSMSYVIDVYRGHVTAVRDVVQFLAFVSFFPQLVAGPIERATRLLPQFARRLHITPAAWEQGLWLVIWGLFQKVVLADSLAPLVELVYDHATPSLPLLVLGTVAFGLQIYCDFAGYSDIARGLAKFLGFELMINFNLPYLATSLREFWQRWHISLSTWIRDYLYFPLGGNRQGEGRTRLNLIVVMLLAGLWHGAGLNFVLWGLWHGCGLVINHAWNRMRPAGFKVPRGIAWLLTMAFVLAGWVLFRVRSSDQLARVAAGLTQFQLPMWWGTYAMSLAVLAMPLVAMHLWQLRHDQKEPFLVLSSRMRILCQGALLMAVVAWWKLEAASFIYFQF